MENLFTLSPLAVGAIPLVVGVIAILKEVGLPTKFAALTSLAIGVAVVALTGANVQEMVAQGVLVGLSASGLFSGSKALING